MKNGIKIAVLSAALLAAGGVSAVKPVAVKADGESEVTSSVVTSSEEPVADSEDDKTAEEKAVDEVKEWAKAQWNTLVAPIISGVSITAIISFATTVVMNYVRNKKLDKKLVEVKENLLKTTETLTVINGIYKDLEETKTISEESKEAVKSVCTEIVEKLNLTVEQSETISKMEPVLKLLVQLESKVALASDEAVKAGIIDDIREVQNLIQNI